MVEAVINGGLLRVTVVNAEPILCLQFSLAGVAAPRVPAGAAPASPAPASPAAKAVAVRLAPRASPGSALVAGSEAEPGAATPPKLTWATKAPSSPAPASPAAGGSAARGGGGGGAGGAPPADVESSAAAEAKAWVESVALHRLVTLHVAGADKHGVLCGRLELPGAPGLDVAAELLRAGLAKVAEWTLPLVPAAAHAGLRAAERAARDARARLWTNYAPPAPAAGARAAAAGAGAGAAAPAGERRYDARVAEVISGDQLLLVPAGGGAERRVSLASVRAPLMGRPARGGGGGDDASAATPAAPWAAEAREFLRRLLAGRDVTVAVDYTRDFGEGRERAFATVALAGRKGDDAPRASAGACLVSEFFAPPAFFLAPLARLLAPWLLARRPCDD